MTLPSLTRFKRCSKCRCWKPVTCEFFTRFKYHSTGFHPQCKACKNLDKKAYRAANADKIRAGWLKWFENNTDAKREMDRRWRENNREKYLETQREYGKRTQAERPEFVREQRRTRQAKRRAVKAKTGGSHTRDELWEVYESQDGLCCWCDAPLFGSFHADHFIPLSEGGTSYISNIVAACASCNIGKGSKMPLKFLSFLGYDTV